MYEIYLKKNLIIIYGTKLVTWIDVLLNLCTFLLWIYIVKCVIFLNWQFKLKSFKKKEAVVNFIHVVRTPRLRTCLPILVCCLPAVICFECGSKHIHKNTLRVWTIYNTKLAAPFSQKKKTTAQDSYHLYSLCTRARGNSRWSKH